MQVHVDGESVQLQWTRKRLAPLQQEQQEQQQVNVKDVPPELHVEDVLPAQLCGVLEAEETSPHQEDHRPHNPNQALVNKHRKRKNAHTS